MSSSARLLFARQVIPSLAAAVALVGPITTDTTRVKTSRCDTAVPTQSLTGTSKPKATTSTTTKNASSGMNPNAEGDFHNLFPRRQLWSPKLEYPLWDTNWDGRHPTSAGIDPDEHRRRMRELRQTGVTRHIILVRHGQYVETEQDDSKRILTPLGREQADYTGKRLRELLDGVNEEFGPCNIKVVRVSDMARAKETADIIASHFPPNTVERADPDPELNEGRPCHNIPGGKASSSTIAKTEENHPRIEAAFQKYFYRAPEPKSLSPDVTPADEGDDNAESTTVTEEVMLKEVEEPLPPRHEFEVIVCHANVIRYFLCRALQLPPEAWLRLCTFNCSLTYLTIRPTGTVSCRMLGDIGHIPYGKSTFSMHPGFNW